MKRLICFFALSLMALMAFGQDSIQVVAGDATPVVGGIENILALVGGIIAVIVGHFAIPSKWASVVKWLLVLFKGIVSILEQLDKTNKGKTVK